MWLEILRQRGWTTALQLSFVHAIRNHNQTGIDLYHPRNWMHEDEQGYLPEVLREIAANYPQVSLAGQDLV